MSVQSALYAALGSFVATALLAVTGALSGSALGIPALAVGLGLGALLVGSVATGCLFYACTMLVRETRLALMGMREDVTPFGHILPSPGAPK
jgi:hypothetical protein